MIKEEKLKERMRWLKVIAECESELVSGFNGGGFL